MARPGRPRQEDLIMSKLVSRIALTLALIAAPCAVLAPPSPASACGPYTPTPEVQIRTAALADVNAMSVDAPSTRIRTLKIDGKSAAVTVQFTPKGNTRAMVLRLSLSEDEDGTWS